MNIIYISSVLFAIVFLSAYVTHPKWMQIVKNPYFLIVFSGIAIRLAALTIDAGYINDINCFKAWSGMLFENGLSNFYLSDAFTDYPPGYMYVLFLLGMIRKVFNLDFSGSTFTFIIMLPAMIFDILTCVFIYKISSKRINPVIALFISLAYALNPAIIIDSSVWGQVDSVYTLLLLGSIYLLTEKKYLKSFLLFAVGLLVKPQALIFSPVFIFAVYDYVDENKFSKKSIVEMLKYIGLAALLLFLGILPFTKRFDFTPVIKQYMSTITSYPYASVNAFNFFALIGSNWVSVSDKWMFFTYSTWGILFVIVIVFIGFLLLRRNKSKRNYFFTAAVINTLTFMFSMRMHERYLFPTLAFLIVSFGYKMNKRTIALFAGFSITLLINCASVLAMLHNGSDMKYINDVLMPVSLINLFLSAFMLFTAVKEFEKDGALDDAVTENQVTDSEEASSVVFMLEKSEAPLVMNIKDFAILAGITLIYSVVAFVNLGDAHAPQTQWSPHISQEEFIDLGREYELSKVQFFNGPRIDKYFKLSFSNDAVSWSEPIEVKCDTVFSWREQSLDARTRYVKLVTDYDQLFINEMSFRDSDGAIIPLTGFSETAAYLFDEQEYVPETNTFMNSTYFDEIYHARTAYEFIHGLSVYETTHPPLGKDLISLGILMFGMTPFGWRFIGTVVGILMIPLIYLFAKKMFKSTNWAAFATVLFTFDFMHFAQTRISTIDSYVTLFIMGMYFFMYLYCTKSFYDTKFYKTLIPLALSGLFTGLAIAAKWQGVYAALGLPFIFFYTLHKRYREYVESRKQENIQFSETTKNFPKYAAITLGCCVVFFVAVPLIIYTVSYIPFINTEGANGIKSILDNQTAMFSYHSALTATHPYESKWWSWPIDIRPIFYYIKRIGDDMGSGISSFGNPAVWWVGTLAIFYCANEQIKKANKTLMFLTVAVLAEYLPWVFITRATFIYHFFPSVPFVVLMITFFFKDYVYGKKEYHIGRVTVQSKWVVAGYAAIVVVLFAMFYPVLSGMTIPIDYVNKFLKWLPGWQLI